MINLHLPTSSAADIPILHTCAALSDIYNDFATSCLSYSLSQQVSGQVRSALISSLRLRSIKCKPQTKYPVSVLEPKYTKLLRFIRHRTHAPLKNTIAKTGASTK
jgi:hypothetical protein